MPEEKEFHNTLDEKYMRMALQLAAGCRGQTSPNPMVGAVIVKDGEVVGVGAHLKAGEAHAEVHALRTAGDKAEGSTVYVTLEPCSHTGRTPPCADALIRHKVSRVVIATLDPNPRVAGRGAQRIREAGIEVVTGLLGQEAEKLNEVFNKYIVKRLPFVTVKTASTLDGKVATVAGSSRWITGEHARREVHQLRHEHDAILVGVNTIIADDPQLTVRLPGGGTSLLPSGGNSLLPEGGSNPLPDSGGNALFASGRNPLRIVLDSRLRIPITARVIVDNQAPTWVFTTDKADPEKKQLLEEKGIRVFSSGPADKVDIPAMLKILGDHEISSVLVEGGSQVNGSFLEAGCIDKVISYIAMKLVGGGSAPTAFGGLGIAEMSGAVRLEHADIQVVGEDIRITGYPRFES